MASSKRAPLLSASAAAAAALALALLGAASPALATPNFPPRIQAELGLGAAPACTLCHEGPTQRGTVTTPFGVSMLSRGLDAYDEQLLVNALLALDGEGKDSDGDGAPDIDELRQGDDPNAGPGGDAPIVPDYGCSVAAPPGQRPGGGALSAWAPALLLALAALARRSAPRGPRG